MLGVCKYDQEPDRYVHNGLYMIVLKQQVLIEKKILGQL